VHAGRDRRSGASVLDELRRPGARPVGHAWDSNSATEFRALRWPGRPGRRALCAQTCAYRVRLQWAGGAPGVDRPQHKMLCFR